MTDKKDIFEELVIISLLILYFVFTTIVLEYNLLNSLLLLMFIMGIVVLIEILVNKYKEYRHNQNLELRDYDEFDTLYTAKEYTMFKSVLNWIKSKSYILVWIILGVTLILLLSTAGYGYNYYETYTYTDEELPVSGTSEGYQFPTLGDNSTLFFNVNESQSQLVNLSFPENYTFVNSTGSYLFNISFTVLDNFYADSKKYNTSIIVSNNVNNNTASIGIGFNIVKTNPSFILNGSEDLTLHNGTWIKRVSVINLPSRGNMSFLVKGEPEQTFTVKSCTDFLQCPVGEFQYGSDGTKLITLDYDIPVLDGNTYTTVGKYKQFFSVESNNVNTTVSVDFLIENPQFVIQPLELNSSCRSDAPFDILQDCYQQLAEYNLELITGYNRYISLINPDTICADYKQIEYVVGDSIGKEVLDRNVELMDTNDRLRSEVNRAENRLNRCEQEKVDMRIRHNETLLEKEGRIQDIIKESIKNEYKQNVQTEQEKEVARQSYLGKILYAVFILATLPLVMIAYGFYMTYTQNIIKRYPYMWLGVISIVFYLVWIALYLRL